jgi:uncharacterized sulfatase
VKNIAADPAYAKAREDLSARLMKRLTDARDPRVTGDGMTFERPPFTGPVDDAEGARGQKKKATAKKGK